MRAFGDSFAAMAGDRRIAYFYGAFSDWPKETAEANARLGAAAPDLLAACVYAIEDIAIGTEAYSMMKAAIAKAEGR